MTILILHKAPWGAFQLSVGTISMGCVKTRFSPRPSHHGLYVLGDWGNTSMALAMALEQHIKEVARSQQERVRGAARQDMLSSFPAQRPKHQPVAFSPAWLCRWAHLPWKQGWLWRCSLVSTQNSWVSFNASGHQCPILDDCCYFYGGGCLAIVTLSQLSLLLHPECRAGSWGATDGIKLPVNQVAHKSISDCFHNVIKITKSKYFKCSII